MQSILTKISEIKANPNNPRIIKDDKFAKLVKSIKEFPKMLEIRPIVVNDDMVVLGWNMRLKACKEAGLKEVHIVRASDLTEQEQREFIIKDNSGFGEWDMDMLANEWSDCPLADWGLDIDTPKEVDAEKELIEDIIPEDDEEIFVQEWDIYKLGNHTLMCGDSMSEENIKTLLKGKNKAITHCISDPPYGISYNPDRHGMIKNDDKIMDYTALGKKYSDGFFCMWTGYQVVDQWIQLVRSTFKDINNVIIWHKGGGGMWDCARTLAQDYELLLVVNRGNEIQGYRGSATWYWNSEEKEKFIKNASKEAMKEVLTTLSQGQAIWKVWKDDVSEYLHPTQKPVEINQRVLENFTGESSNVLDLFGWSGSNLIACEKTNRTCYMMELDPKYVQTIIKRFKAYTGGGAKIECINREVDFDIWE